MQGNISAIMQTTLDAPIFAAKSQEGCRISLLGREAGQAIGNVASSPLILGMPGNSFQAENLGNVGSVQLIIQQGSDENRDPYNHIWEVGVWDEVSLLVMSMQSRNVPFLTK
jgi:hypothetical protein